MGLFDAARDLLWPRSAPLPLRADPPKALADATVPRDRDWTIQWAWQDGDGAIALVGGLSASYAAMYRKQPWVHIAVNKLSRGIGRLPLKVYAGADRARDRDSPLARLLAEPYPGGSPSALKQAIVGDLAVYGNALIIKQGPRGQAPDALYPVSPLGWSIDEAGDYRWRRPSDGRERVYAPERIIHLRFWAPGGGDFGLSPLEPLRITLAIEDAAQRLGIAAFKHGGNTPGLLRTDAKLADVKAGVERIAQDWQRKHGGVDNAYKTPVLTDGLLWQATGGTLADAAVVEHRRLTREEVAAVYDIPPPVIGLLDKATFSNITEQGRWLVQHTYNVWTTTIEETLAAQLIAGEPAFAGRFVEFDTAEILKGAPEQRFNAYAQAIQAGWVTQNEVRSWENLPRMDDPDADRLHRPMNLTPAAPGGAMSQTGGTSNAGT